MRESIRKIDLHVHAVPRRGLPKPSGNNYPVAAELRDMYDALNIEKGVLLPPGSAPEGTWDRVSQREAADMAKENPDVFTAWFCNVDPRQGANSPETDFAYYLRYYQEQGARGVGEITAPLAVDDPRMFALFKHCEICHLPVLMHFGAHGSAYGVRDELHLPRLEKALQSFPHLIFIGHSQAFWCELSGDAQEADRTANPTGPVRPGGTLVRLMEQYDNLHAEMSSLSGANAMLRDPAFTCDFLTRFENRILYGTDFHDPRNLQTYDAYQKLSDFLQTAAENRKITETCYRSIVRDNALRLLKGAAI